MKSITHSRPGNVAPASTAEYNRKLHKICRCMNYALQQAGFEEKLFHTGEIQMNYIEGPGRDHPLLLIPGQTATWESYLHVLEPLSKNFHVYAIDMRGHGRSDWTPGKYSFKTVGRDIRSFIRNVIGKPAIISGNSCGGLVALWLGANASREVSHLILEDAPIFSAEWPRFRDDNGWVYQRIKNITSKMKQIADNDLSEYFHEMKMPFQKGDWIMRLPEWAIQLLTYSIRKFREKHPVKPVDLWFLPYHLRVLIKSLSMFDPDFSRAWVDGRFHRDMSHSWSLQRLKCPALLMHASWFRHPEYGLIGAMDDQDVAHAMALAPKMRYKKIHSSHVIHFFKPKSYVETVEHFITA